MNTKSLGFLIIIIGIALIIFALSGVLAANAATNGDYVEALALQHNIMYGGIGLFLLGGIVAVIGMNKK